MIKFKGSKKDRKYFPWEENRDKKYESGYSYASQVGFYNTQKWRKTRNYVLDNEPLCRLCLERGKFTPANVVDHIKPISKKDLEDYHKTGDETIVYDFDNLRPLCDRCHRVITNKERGKGSAENLRRGRDLMKDLES